MKNNGDNIDFNLKIILLAAGKSKRFKGIKLLAKAQQGNSITLIQHVLQQISASMNTLKINESNLYVATGIYHPQIADFIGEQFSPNFCGHAGKGMGHTIAQSVKEVLKDNNNTTHIMITLADQIALTSDNYIHLIKESLTTPDKLICAKVGDQIMPPAIFPSDYFADLMTLQGDKGAKPLLHANKNNLQKISMPNAAIDIDTPQDLILWYRNNRS